MKSVVVGTAGHIDHGKSALVRALTGTDPDRLKEEKARGITIDLGFAHTSVGDVNVAFVDVPGHERFVKNMLAGVGGIDLVVLVVAADESVMPQTREHFDICRLLRIPAGLVAITKSDLVDPDTLELVRLEIRELVAGSFLERAPAIPVSSRTGDGLEAFRRALAAAAAGAAARSSAGAPRLPIDRVFSMKGFGTVVTGTLVAGTIRVDEELVVVPGERRVKVRGAQVHGARQRMVSAGQRSALNLGGVDVDQIGRGDTLIAPGTLEETRLADAAIELLAGAKPLKHGARVRFHQGTAEILGRVAVIGPTPAPLAPGGRAFARLRLEQPATITRGDRFILRAYSPPLTIAGGQILDPRPPRAAIRTQAAADRFRAIDIEPDGGRRAILSMIDAADRATLPIGALVSRAGIAPADLEACVADLASRGAVRIGDVLVSTRVVDALSGAVVETLSAHHKTSPLSEGLPREELRERLFARGHPAVFVRVVENLAAAGKIAGRDRLALAGHRLALSPDETRAREAIEQAYRAGGLTPPDAAAMAAQAGVSGPVADRVLQLLQRQRVLVRIDTLLFHEDALQRLKRDVAALKTSPAAGGRIDVGTFKTQFNVTRKFAIPLLEYLDRERVTRRVGDVRVVL